MNAAPARGLAGRRIVNTRAPHQAAAWSRRLQEVGAVPLEFPCWTLAPPSDAAPFEEALTAFLAGRFRWLVLTSANTVEALWRRMGAFDGAARTLPPGCRVAAVGSATAAAVRARWSVGPIHLPKAFTGRALAEDLPIAPGDAVFLPQSERARGLLARRLAERGAVVTAAAAYRPAAGEGGVDLPQRLREDGVDAISLASPSAVRGLVERLWSAGFSPEQLRDWPSACLGPETAGAARAAGLRVAAVAQPHTLEGLVAALAQCFHTEVEADR